MGIEVSYKNLHSSEGTDLGATDWMEIDQTRVNGFADATDDYQWIHVDPEKALNGPFGTTIAHGYLTLALVNKFLPQLITVTDISMGVNYGCNRVRFPSPVKVGARIRGRGEVIAVEEVTGGKQVVVRITVEIESNSRPACVVDTISRFYP